MRVFIYLFSISVLLFVAGCSSSGSGGGSPPAPPPVPALNPVGFDIKQLQFSWNAVSNATFYRLFESLDSGASYSQIGSDFSTTSYSHDIAVHTFNWTGASYVLQACHATACSANSAPIAGIASGILSTIGYIKGSPMTGPFPLFGFAVALSADGNTLAVGARDERTKESEIHGTGALPDCDGLATCSNSGKVYVYRRSNGVWALEEFIKAPNVVRGNRFGSSLTLSTNGDVLVVGAPWENDTATAVGDIGGAHVYSRTGTTWSYERHIQAPHVVEESFFGTRVALSGDGETLVVSAPKDDSAQTGIFGAGGALAPDCGGANTNCANRAGAIHVYTRSAGTWPLQAYVKASNTAPFEEFGTSLSISRDGNTIAVGAVLQLNAGLQAGAVYVYVRDASLATPWVEEEIIRAASPDSGDRFGSAVALSADGNTLAVGADSEESAATGIGGAQTDNSASKAGAVYVYTRTSLIGWTVQEYIKATNSEANDYFGSSIALSDDGNMLAVAAYGESSAATGVGGDQTDNSATNAGAVYLYQRSGITWTARSYIKAPNTEAGDEFGYGTRDTTVPSVTTTTITGHSLALSGDGTTLAVGASLEDGAGTGIGTGTGSNPNPADNSALETGAVYLY